MISKKVSFGFQTVRCGLPVWTMLVCLALALSSSTSSAANCGGLFDLFRSDVARFAEQVLKVVSERSAIPRDLKVEETVRYRIELVEPVQRVVVLGAPTPPRQLQITNFYEDMPDQVVTYGFKKFLREQLGLMSLTNDLMESSRGIGKLVDGKSLAETMRILEPRFKHVSDFDIIRIGGRSYTYVRYRIPVTEEITPEVIQAISHAVKRHADEYYTGHAGRL